MLNTSAYASTTTLTSVNTTFTTSSTTPLRVDRSSSRPKTEEEYLALFGALQNQYGFSGTAPTRTTVSRSKTREQRLSTSPKSEPSPAQPKRPLTEHERKFADFAVTYGFSGNAPVIPTITPSKSNKSLKFWKRAAV